MDENLTDRIAALKSIISEIFRAARLQKQRFQKFFRASCGLDIYRWFYLPALIVRFRNVVVVWEVMWVLRELQLLHCHITLALSLSTER